MDISVSQGVMAAKNGISNSAMLRINMMMAVNFSLLIFLETCPTIKLPIIPPIPQIQRKGVIFSIEPNSSELKSGNK